MTKEEKPVPRRKTEQAIKISASWTPIGEVAAKMAAQVFGDKTPLAFIGGRLSVNAHIAADMADPASMVRVSERVAELKQELAGTGILHSFITQAGAVPAGKAERLPEAAKEDSE